MILIPAIDLMEGNCVRLTRGKAECRKVYFRNPLEPLKMFQSAGIEWIHIVDLDAAMGYGDNLEIIRKMLRQATVKVEVAGGIRSIEKAESLLRFGASRVVLGTAIARNPENLDWWVRMLGREVIAVALDLKGKNVMMEGWMSETGVDHSALVRKINDADVAAAILTSIDKDGTLEGPDLKLVEAFKEVVRVPLISSGGVSSMRDLKNLEKTRVDGVIVGKAIYEGMLDLKEAFDFFHE